MASSGIARWDAIGLVLGSVIWVVLGLSSVVGYLQAIPGREDVVLFIVALALTAAGLAGPQAPGGDYDPRRGREAIRTVRAADVDRPPVLGLVAERWTR